MRIIIDAFFRRGDASPWTILRHVRLMAALPSFGAGLRVAAAVAPIGAIIGEETGFIGIATIIALFVVFTYRAVRIALGTSDRFGFFLAIGCMTTIVIQAFVNLGVISASWPVTGVPLPFISFGGSSLVTSLVAAALIVNVGRYRHASAAPF